MASRYGKKASDKVETEMHKYKRGTLKSGSGKKVTSRKQAIAIGLSEARREGGKVPSAPKGSSSTSKKGGASKKGGSSSKKGSTKKASTKKASTKKASSTKKSSASRKTTTKKSSSKKSSKKK